MFKRLLEILFHLKPGFFSSEGELTWHFDPHWPGPLIGEVGRWQNYLLGAVAVAMLVVLLRRTSTRRLHQLRLGLAAGSAAMVALFIPASLGLHWWGILLVIATFSAIAGLYFTRREVGLMALGRAAAFILLLIVISGARLESRAGDRRIAGGHLCLSA